MWEYVRTCATSRAEVVAVRAGIQHHRAVEDAMARDAAVAEHRIPQAGVRPPLQVARRLEPLEQRGLRQLAVPRGVHLDGDGVKATLR